MLTTEAQHRKHYFWGNPNVFECGIFEETEIECAPKDLVARNPACASYVLSHWDMFKDYHTVWRNPALWECLKTQIPPFNQLTKMSLELHPCDLRELAKNPHPEAVLYLQERGIPLDRTNPRFIFNNATFVFHGKKVLGTSYLEVWANPSAVPFLKEIIANDRQPSYAWLRDNPDPWAVQLYLKHTFENQNQSKAEWENIMKYEYPDLFQNAGIFESVDFSEVHALLLRVGCPE